MSKEYSIDGYKSNSPDRNNPYNVIPSGRITMNNVPHPVMGMDDRGNRQLMYPGNEYQFPGNKVLEIPLKDTNMNKKVMKNGGSNMFWNGTKWVSSADGGTYSNGVYYQQGGPTFPNGGAAPIYGMGGTASFNVSNNEYPTPFAMYPGTGNGSGYLQDLPTTMQMGGTTTRDGEYIYPFAMYAGSGQGGGMLQDLPTEMKTGGNWIKGAVNPAHKGYCTPMTKATCTPRRKAFAMTMKKHHGFHEYGGMADPLAKFQMGNPKMQDGGRNYMNNAWASVNPQDDIVAQIHEQQANTQDVVQNSDMYGRPNITGTNPDGMTPMQNNIIPGQQNTQQPSMANGNPLSAWGNAVFGAGMLGLADASIFSDINRQKEDRLRNTRRGLSENSVGVYNPQSGHGDYSSQGIFRPDQHVPTRAGYFPSAMHSNGYMQHGGYTQGQELDMDEAGIENLRRMGYQFEML